MAQIIYMPLLDGVTEGVLIRWHKVLGEYVRKGENLAEIETDKSSMDLPSPYEGVLKEMVVKEGEAVEFGGEIAIVEQELNEKIAKNTDTELVAESLKCGNCGASLSLKNTVCGYCGSDNIIRRK